MSDEKRVVLVKPGDVLLIGGARFNSAEHGAETVQRFRELTGITPVVFFADDIQIDQLTTAQLWDLLKRADSAGTYDCCGGQLHTDCPTGRDPRKETKEN